MATRTAALSRRVGVEAEPLGAPTASLASVPAAAVLVAVAAGAVLGVIYTLSPLTVWFAAASVLLIRLGTRGLPAREARWIGSVLVAAIAVRGVIVGGLFLLGTPDHMWFNTFFGDEQYLLVRSLRLRHLWLGSPISLEALFDVFDSYGQTSYLDVIAYVQMLVGPAPYGIHLLNAVLSTSGALVLHRLVRQAFGPVPAALTLGGTLFFPSLVIWSASGLKESLNFLVVMCVLWATIALFRARWRWRPFAMVAVVALLAALRTFRAGAFEITMTGIVLGLAARVVTRRLWRAAFVTAALVAAAAVFFTAPAARERVQQLTLRALRPAAYQHMGHVFTRGHSYKLLDQRLYDVKRVDSMTWDEGLRFVRRATISVVLFPLPWDAQSRAELAYLPEQLAWYLVLVLAAAGIVAGVRKDALLTSVLGGYALTALMVVALNSGNIGTLVRHRSLALPFLIAFSAVGVTAIVSRLAAPSGAASSAA
jgi:hypothetical protein